MTDNEIIKALKLCPKRNMKSKCTQCPYFESDGICLEVLMADSLDLINRQKAEIERLEHSAKQWEDTAKDIFISRENIKAEAIKEFAERLEEILARYECSFIEIQNWSARNTILQVIQELRNLVKEMVGESNA